MKSFRSYNVSLLLTESHGKVVSTGGARCSDVYDGHVFVSAFEICMPSCLRICGKCNVMELLVLMLLVVVVLVLVVVVVVVVVVVAAAVGVAVVVSSSTSTCTSSSSTSSTSTTTSTSSTSSS